MEISKEYLKDLTYKVTGAAIKVHKHLGPGLLESVYHRCMKYELSKRKISFQSELRIPIIYDSLELEADLRCDLYINTCFVVELKAVEYLHPIHDAQLMTYMKLLNAPKGMLLNFNVSNLYSDGQKTLVSSVFRDLPD